MANEFTAKPTEEQTQRSEEFHRLCENALSSYHILGKDLDELHALKDELVTHSLPTRLLTRLTVLMSGILRSQSDHCVPLHELVRMVRLYAASWEDKMAVLQAIQEQQDIKQKQVSIALKKIEVLASEGDKLDQQRATNNWTMLFSRVMMGKSHGRRWKFRMKEFKKNFSDGCSQFNPFALGGGEGRTRDAPADREKAESPSSASKPSSLPSRRGSKRSKMSSEVLSATPVKVVAPPPPRPVMVDKTVSTGDVAYQGYLLVRLYHPLELAADKDLVCNLKYRNEIYQSKTFTPAVGDSPNREFHDFHLELTAADLGSVREPGLLGDGPSQAPPPTAAALLRQGSFAVAVHPQDLSNAALAGVAVKMGKAKLEGPPSVMVPPVDRDRPFDVGWDYIAAVMREEDAALYLCDGGSPFKLKILCHLVKLQRHHARHSATSTLPLEECALEMGFKKTVEATSRATSARRLEMAERGVVTSMVWDLPAAQEASVPRPPSPSPTEEKASAEEVARMALEHAQELQSLQEQYESRLESLAASMQQLQLEKGRREEELHSQQQELVAQLTSQLDDQESARKLKNKLSKKLQKPSIAPAKPWGRDFPEDFFERMELFARESLRRQSAMAERIKNEIAVACERQLAVQHKLAPVGVSRVAEGLNDVCLPALYMPTPLGHIYTPRAHQYFHSSSGESRRVTQPPSIFKLPSLPAHQTRLATVNLFDLSRRLPESSLPIAMATPGGGEPCMGTPPTTSAKAPPPHPHSSKAVHFYK